MNRATKDTTQAGGLIKSILKKFTYTNRKRQYDMFHIVECKDLSVYIVKRLQPMQLIKIRDAISRNEICYIDFIRVVCFYFMSVCLMFIILYLSLSVCIV